MSEILRTSWKQMVVLALVALALSAKAAPELQSTAERGITVAKIVARHALRPAAEVGIRQVVALLPASMGHFLLPASVLSPARPGGQPVIRRVLVLRMGAHAIRRSCTQGC